MEFIKISLSSYSFPTLPDLSDDHIHQPTFSSQKNNNLLATLTKNRPYRISNIPVVELRVEKEYISREVVTNLVNWVDLESWGLDLAGFVVAVFLLRWQRRVISMRNGLLFGSILNILTVSLQWREVALPSILWSEVIVHYWLVARSEIARHVCFVFLFLRRPHSSFSIRWCITLPFKHEAPQ